MAEIDSLEIKISAESKDAESSLDRIIQKIESLGQLTKANNNLPKVLSGLSSNVSTNGIDKATDSLKNLSEKSTSAAENIRQNCSKIADAVDSIGQKLSSDIKTPTIDFGNNNYRKTIQENADATKQSAESIKESIQDVSESYEKANEEQSKFGNFSFGKLATDAAVLSGAIDKIGEKLSKLGDLGQKALGFMYIPLKGVVNEYKEKLENIKGHFDEFFKKVKTGLTKLSAFWKRAMRTFTFMILRKAFTQIIKDIGEATESLALFSKEFGTTFNENISNAIADFKWIGKALVGAFEPIINVVVPILNVLSAALVKVITLLGHFFAALTGQSYYMVAKKKVDDYADSLKKAAKEAKKSIRPFDELNLITSGNKSDTDTGVNPAADWEMKPVSDKMKKFADMIKDIAKKLFAPIKAAWDRTKDYVISGFKYMVGELGKLAKSIGRDFLKAWQEEQTIHIFENIFNMVGDIERVVGNFAKNFRKAWDTVVDGETRGYWIFHNILKIIDTITTHLRNVTKYMVEWSESITFDALLDSFIRLLSALDKVADFIGGVFEDVMKNVVLEYIKWLIEEGTPHLLNTISEIIDAFDFDKIREDLVPVEKAFEKLLENIHTGVTNAIGVLGKALADWMNSENFTKFMESLAHIMQQITAERVEKVLEALGLAILQIAEAVADFVSSEGFLKFIDKIGEWIDSKSAEDLAGYVKGIIELTAAFKGLGVVLPIISKIVKTATMLKAVSDINKIVKGLSKAKGAGKVIKFGSQETVLGEMSSILTKIQAGFGKVAQAATSAASKISTLFTSDIGANLAAGGATAGATIGAAIIGGITAAIAGFNFGKWLGDKLFDPEKTGIYKDFKLFDFKNLFSGDVKADLQASFDAVVNMFTDFENNPAIASMTTFLGSLSMPLVTLGIHLTNLAQNGGFDKIKEGFESLKEKAGQLKEDVAQKWSAIQTDIKTKSESIKNDVSTTWQTIKTDVSTQLNQIKTDSSAKWAEIKTNATAKITELKTNIQTKWAEIKSFFNQGIADIKAKFANFSLASAGSRIINSFLSGIRSAWQNVSSFLNNKVQEIKSKLNLNFSFNASGSGGGIRSYASGGFPEDGWFRASHGELMGQFDNGQSVVANNHQIVDGIKAGVFDAMMQAIPSLAQAVSNDTTVVVEGDMNKMFRAMVKENYGANKRTFNASPLYS